MNRRQYEKRNFSQLVEPNHEIKESVIFLEYEKVLESCNYSFQNQITFE